MPLNVHLPSFQRWVAFQNYPNDLLLTLKGSGNLTLIIAQSPSRTSAPSKLSSLSFNKLVERA